VGKDVCDFGCGPGSFLRRIQGKAASIHGIELQKAHSKRLNDEGIMCHSSLSNLPGKVDLMTMFHCLEHLPDPIAELENSYEVLNTGGSLIVEVPHARDFLIEILSLQTFIKSTLWSQHLILHTRESLRAMLESVGFKDVIVSGVQRYGISNHLTWLKKETSGGHKLPISIFETKQLASEYANALARVDATDTLVAIARK
jgi:trans-aconitate methyltransferase